MKSQEKSFRYSRIIYIILPSLLIVCSGFFFTRIARPNWWNRLPEWESAWLANPTCELPCFEKLVPGETKRESLKTIFGEHAKIFYTESREVIPYGSVLFLDLSDNKQCCDAKVFFDNANTLRVIELSPEEGFLNPQDINSLLGTGLYLDDIVPIYENPDKVIFLYWAYGYTTFNLVYSKFGMIVELDGFSVRQDNAKVEIQGYSPIGKIYLGTPDFEFLFEHFRISGATVTASYPWEGYAMYPE